MLLCRGVEQSKDKAREYFEKAANKDYRRAEYNLGTQYYELEKAYNSDAVYYYERAARHGYPPAYEDIAHSFEEGIGIKESNEEAKCFHAMALKKSRNGFKSLNSILSALITLIVQCLRERP